MGGIEDLHEYDRFADNGLEQCPLCGRDLTGQQSYIGAVYSQNGQQYDHIHETDAAAGPYYCASCWGDYENRIRAVTNRRLTEYA